VSRYPFLATPFIGEIFVRLAYIDPIENAEWAGGIPSYLFPSSPPSIDVPDTLIATGASLPEKLWPAEKWESTAKRLRDAGLRVGLLGAPPKRQREFYHSDDGDERLVRGGLCDDLRGRLSLPEVVGALERAKLVVTLDNGILHFAAASNRPTVGLFRRDISRLWAPPNPNLIVLTPRDGPVAMIPESEVWSAIDQAVRVAAK
jgi:heptosyltransferase-1